MYCIYHGGCIDGFSSALQVWREYPEATFFAGHHGDQPPLKKLKDEDVLMVDFAYKRDAMLKVAEQCRSLTVLDHHDSAERALDGLEDEVDVPCEIVFDQDRSGAGLTHDFLHPKKLRPRWVDLVEDRDLWRFKYGDDARHLHYSLTSYPQEFKLWDKMLRDDRVRDLLEEGVICERYHMQIVDDLCKAAFKIDFPKTGHKQIPIVCAPYHFASDIGDRLGADAPFAATYSENENGLSFSLRSRDPGGVAVNKIAEAFGGGGHPHAAGFRLVPEQRWW